MLHKEFMKLYDIKNSYQYKVFYGDEELGLEKLEIAEYEEL